MGIQAEIQTEVGLAFDAEDELADAVRVLTFIDNKNSIYNPVTGEFSESGLTYPSRGTVAPYTQLEIAVSGGAIDSTDYKVLVLQNELAVAPKTDFMIEISNLKYRIISIKRDPADAAYIFHVRQS